MCCWPLRFLLVCLLALFLGSGILDFDVITALRLTLHGVCSESGLGSPFSRRVTWSAANSTVFPFVITVPWRCGEGIQLRFSFSFYSEPVFPAPPCLCSTSYPLPTHYGGSCLYIKFLCSVGQPLKFAILFLWSICLSLSVSHCFCS